MKKLKTIASAIIVEEGKLSLHLLFASPEAAQGALENPLGPQRGRIVQVSVEEVVPEVEKELPESHGTCFFCLECVTGWRVAGWDLVFQSPVCGPCLRRIRLLQEKVYDPNAESLYQKVEGGAWATDEARIWNQARHERTEKVTQ